MSGFMRKWMSHPLLEEAGGGEGEAAPAGWEVGGVSFPLLIQPPVALA